VVMSSADNSPANKASQLEAGLQSLGRVLVAYSGGIDSAYLAWAAHRVLGNNMVAVIADSASLARTQLADALAFADEQGIPVEVITTSELERPEYARNDGQRCFQCKDELFTVMEQLRSSRGFDAIAYGVNVDDQGDFRPGQQAAKRHHVAAPLLKAGLTKQDIRDLARAAGRRARQGLGIHGGLVPLLCRLSDTHHACHSARDDAGNRVCARIQRDRSDILRERADGVQDALPGTSRTDGLLG